MAMSPAAKALKDRKKAKSKKYEAPKDDAATVEMTEDDLKVADETLSNMAA